MSSNSFASPSSKPLAQFTSLTGFDSELLLATVGSAVPTTPPSVTTQIQTVTITPTFNAQNQSSFTERIDKQTITVLSVALALISLAAIALAGILYSRNKLRKTRTRRVSLVESTNDESRDLGRWVPREISGPGSLISSSPQGLPQMQEWGAPVSTLIVQQTSSITSTLEATRRRSAAPLSPRPSPFISVGDQRITLLTSNNPVSTVRVSEDQERVGSPVPTPSASRTTRDSESTWSDGGSIVTPPSYRSTDSAEGGGTTPTLDDPFADTGAYQSTRSQGTMGTPPSPPASTRTNSLGAWTDDGSIATLPSYHSFEGPHNERRVSTYSQTYSIQSR
ncbi:hypothetical protein AB1N83_006366 [Pleurotus pulmonarius]